MSSVINLVWFRTDLRLTDNPALHFACKDPQAKVYAIFLLSEQQWLNHMWGVNKLGFTLANVLSLQQSLAKINIPLYIIDAQNFNNAADLIYEFMQQHKCNALFYNREYELNEQRRDQAVDKLLNAKKIAVSAFDEQCLVTPGALLNKEGRPYTVFTPFKKACYQILASSNVKMYAKPKARSNNIDVKADKLPIRLEKYIKNAILHSWPAGEQAAQKFLQKFCATDLKRYKQQRDFPDLDATSKLSAYLAVGAISIRDCFISALHENHGVFPGGSVDVMCWLDELLWRDFYRHIIVHNPRLCMGENYNQKYNSLRWSTSAENFKRWCNAQTGIPIIDAAMRQLVQTGWMHNRLRMIVAMFLTKQLLIDWRKGEEFFCQHLIDLDFASNNGGWQWCASTGTDAVPYFRIFNPITQSQRFDPKGEFIRSYCPELRTLDNKQIHDPSACLTKQQLVHLNYPEIMVDLKQARIQALARYKLN